jgi:hypothetical protein
MQHINLVYALSFPFRKYPVISTLRLTMYVTSHLVSELVKGYETKPVQRHFTYLPV